MKNKKRITIIIITLLVLSGLFIAINNYLNKPSIGTVNISQVTKPTTPTINMSPTVFSSSYVRFDYPAILNKDLKNPPINPVVDDYLFSYNDIQPWNLSISIYLIPGGKLADNNSYQVREIKPSQYQQSSQIVKGQEVVIFSDKTITYYNKVAFLIHGSYQATISLSGDDQQGEGNLVKTLNMILSNWTWKVD
jgi:hypothetical protein